MRSNDVIQKGTLEPDGNSRDFQVGTSKNIVNVSHLLSVLLINFTIGD